MDSLQYSDQYEKLLKKCGEECEAMSLLHQLSHTKLNFLSHIINIPVIVFSSIIGFMSPLDLFKNQALILGILSILISILKSIETTFDFTKTAENHRLTSLNYYRISKFLEIQLSLARENRISPKDLYQIITNDIQNLKDKEPPIKQDIIKKFNQKYKDYNTSKPAILNGLTSILIYKEQININ